jgi:hypothetical protein
MTLTYPCGCIRRPVPVGCFADPYPAAEDLCPTGKKLLAEVRRTQAAVSGVLNTRRSVRYQKIEARRLAAHEALLAHFAGQGPVE